jgi:hypothetical protein
MDIFVQFYNGGNYSIQAVKGEENEACQSAAGRVRSFGAEKWAVSKKM